jgi:hypothetical protein
MSEAELRTYLGKIEKAWRLGNATEHTYRPDLRDLLQELGAKAHITATNEPKREKYGAPDYLISRQERHGLVRIGYVEAKDIGVSLDEIERSDQLQRYRRAIPNLVLTDYLEFRWYVHGDRRATARLASVGAQRKLVWDAVGAPAVTGLLEHFLSQTAEEISQPKDLAERMARLAHAIRDLVVVSLGSESASSTLRDLHQAFKEVLIPDLSHQDFADMFAQTLAYGLFAARYNHPGPALFRRQDAAREIPKTNPFLRKLFTTITGPELDEENFIGFVDDLAQLLAQTNMGAVLADFGKRTRQEDPLVHFYETFLAAYDLKLRELRGVYYTPEPIVSYIVRSVDALLKRDFGCPSGLADTATVTFERTDEHGQTHKEQVPRVLLLDPACGTGTFSYTVIDLIREAHRAQGNAGMWSSYVRQHLLPRLFSFELLMAPYAMAHLKLGMQLAALDLPEEERQAWAYDFRSAERLGIAWASISPTAWKRPLNALRCC